MEPSLAFPSYKILSSIEYRDYLLADDFFTGIALDHNDGFMHLSYFEEVDGTLKKYFKNNKEVYLLKVDMIQLLETHSDVIVENDWVESRKHYFPHIKPSKLYKDAVIAEALATQTDNGNWLYDSAVINAERLHQNDFAAPVRE